jgi:hypothetical protein
MRRLIVSVLTLSFLSLMTLPAAADSLIFSTGDPDGRMATASRPSGNGKIEIESADDFVLTKPTSITHATFTGLLPAGARVSQVIVEIYRVFPKDSDVGRTSESPTFSTSQVPTRVNSPSDVAFDSRDSAASNLNFSASIINASFTAANSVLNGINPIPNQTTSGEGPVTGQEVQFDVAFTTPFDLSADHYFFIPQVLLTSASDEFYWLSAPKPIVPPGTPFPPGETDLQSWIRNENLAPDWLRVGTDIIGGTLPPTFNAAFSLSGTEVPLPGAFPLLGTGLVSLVMWRRLKRSA